MTTQTNYYLEPTDLFSYENRCCILKRSDRPDTPILKVYVAASDVDLFNKLFMATADRAWDEGYAAGKEECCGMGADPNPYMVPLDPNL